MKEVFLKEAIIVAVHKSGDVQEPSNFRSISLLPTVAKVFGTFLDNKISNFLEVFDLLDANQYGLRRQRGTIDALAHFVENARDTLENQPKCSIGLFLDLKKAFDTVDHNLLLRKFANIGLRGPMLEIMKSYLSDRKQILIYGAARTRSRTVTFGVPQGSVLGTLLFIIYVNEIRQQCNCSTITLYADDTALQPKENANEVLFQSDIDNIGLYLSDNKLTLNVKKTIHLNLGFKTMMNVLRLNKATLKKSNEVKYLGVLLDNKLD